MLLSRRTTLSWLLCYKTYHLMLSWQHQRTFQSTGAGNSLSQCAPHLLSSSVSTACLVVRSVVACEDLHQQSHLLNNSLQLLSLYSSSFLSLPRSHCSHCSHCSSSYAPIRSHFGLFAHTTAPPRLDENGPNCTARLSSHQFTPPNTPFAPRPSCRRLQSPHHQLAHRASVLQPARPPHHRHFSTLKTFLRVPPFSAWSHNTQPTHRHIFRDVCQSHPAKQSHVLHLHLHVCHLFSSRGR